VRIRASVGLICVAACACSVAVAASTQADASASGRVYSLAFSEFCSAKSTPRAVNVAPHILGAHAQVTMPSAWRTVLVPPNSTSSGGGCGQPYLLTDARGDASECVQQSVYATVAPGGAETPAAFLANGYEVLAHGQLPTVSGMRGVWAEIQGGVTSAYPVYGVSAAYEAANRKLFYELDVVPPKSESGCPAGSGSLARGIARELAKSFRVDVTDAATSESSSG
jgi:hypothetical protein